MRPLLLIMALLVPGVARADPCEAALPDRAGRTVAGLVSHVIDGDGLCVGRTADPMTWIEVRLSDFDAPELNRPGGREARDRLSRLTMGRTLRCVTTPGRSGRVIVHDRVIAACRLDGRGLGDRLRRSGGTEGGH